MLVNKSIRKRKSIRWDSETLNSGHVFFTGEARVGEKAVLLGGLPEGLKLNLAVFYFLN